MSVTSLEATYIMKVTVTQLNVADLSMCISGALYCDGKDIGVIFIGQQIRLIM
jgi:hypothetical protein